MLARRSLRTKLIVALSLALLPLLGLSAWRSVVEQRQADQRREQAMAAAAELAAARYSELIEGSHRLLAAVCQEEAVLQSGTAEGPPSNVNRCEAYLSRVLGSFPREYSSALVTDDQGVARCSTIPTAVGVSFADHQIFRLVRDTRAFSVGGQIASRLVSNTEIPVALPILRGDEFAGMCMLGISLAAFGEGILPARSDTIIALVDRNGGSVAGDAQATRALPVAARLAAAIVGEQRRFRDYGQDGSRYEFHLLPLTSNSLFVVTAVADPDDVGFLIAAWGSFAILVLALAVVLGVVWIAADYWCVRPLRYIQESAARGARGEDIELTPQRPWGPELASVAEGVQAMAQAIASRETELRAGLEQRDHMLREIHHRVKNNLQMISSLLNLQAGEIRSPRIRRLFGDAQNRVLTLSILHRHLYERSSWSLVDFQQFISDLVRQVSVARQGVARKAPRFQIRAPIMAVGPDTAIPIGLIVTEAVGSAMSHDFSGVAAPEVRIEAKESEGKEVELVIEDNGVDTNRGSLGSHGQGGFGLTL